MRFWMFEYLVLYMVFRMHSALTGDECIPAACYVQPRNNRERLVIRR